MTRFRYVLLGVVATLMSVSAPTTQAVAGEVEAAALPTCNRVTHYYFQGENWWLPNYNGGHNNCLMARGSVGPAVRVLQQALNDCYNFPEWVTRKRNVKKIRIDSIYGPETTRAVQYVQQVERVDDDGVYGPDTHNAMLWPYWWGAYEGPYTFNDCA